MFERLIDFGSIRFGEPLYLWLLVAPAVLFVLWCWQIARRRIDARKYRATRLVPVRERFGVFGDFMFWLALIAALSLTILALSRPQGITAIVRSPGVDIVLLMDGSTSMRVRDVGTDRWQRSMEWVRTLTKTLSWNGDRMALATFADIAVPQVRLTGTEPSIDSTQRVPAVVQKPMKVTVPVGAARSERSVWHEPT